MPLKKNGQRTKCTGYKGSYVWEAILSERAKRVKREYGEKGNSKKHREKKAAKGGRPYSKPRSINFPPNLGWRGVRTIHLEPR